MDRDCLESAFSFRGGNRYNLPPVAPLVTALKQKPSKAWNNAADVEDGEKNL